jgi:uncharacterized membrane protein YfcA
VLSLPVLVALGAATAAIGAIGGLGGAVLLVPVLVLLDVSPAQAAPLGLLAVAAGSLAAGPAQLEEGLVHHRLGLTLETAASAGAVVGALLSDHVSAPVLSRLLALAALAAALAGAARTGMRNLPVAELAAESPGEWPGTLSGAYRLGDAVVPYAARRVPVGWMLTLGAGLVSGIAGIGGGFIKTPVMSEVMHVPVKVAAATTTFTVGLTAAAGLAVFAGQHRLDLVAGSAIVAGAMVGGAVGARLQSALDPLLARRGLSALLVVIAAIVLVRG